MTGEAIRLQGRVLLALMLREARTRYGRTQFGYLWGLIEPCLHIALFMAIFKFLGRNVAIGDSAPMFLATGLATYFGFRNIMRRTAGAYNSNEALLSFPVVKTLDVFLGRALLEFATWVVFSSLLIGGLILAGHGGLPRSVLLMLGAMVSLFFLGFGVGMTLGITSAFYPAVGSLIFAPMRALYFLSGIFYLPEKLAPTARDIIAWNPVLHAITLFREGYYPMYESPLLDVSYLVSWAVGLTLFALILERATRKAIRTII